MAYCKKDFLQVLDIILILLTLSQARLLFYMCLQFKFFENTVGNGEIARQEH